MSTRHPITPADLALINHLLNQQRARCHEMYGHLARKDTDISIMPTTVAIIVLSILLEFWVHVNPLHCGADKEKKDIKTAIAKDDEPLRTIELQHQAHHGVEHRWSEETLPNEVQITMKRTTSSSGWFCSTPAPKSLRIARLCLGFFLYQAIVGSFIIRMTSIARKPAIPSNCAHYFDIPGPNWVAITFLNILPLACATFAMLRAVVDVVLLRWDTGVHCNAEMVAQKKGCPWPPLMPLMLVLFFLGYVWNGLKTGLGKMDRCVRSRKARAERGLDITIEEEEGIGLLDHAGDEETDKETPDTLEEGLGMERSERSVG